MNSHNLSAASGLICPRKVIPASSLDATEVESVYAVGSSTMRLSHVAHVALIPYVLCSWCRMIPKLRWADNVREENVTDKLVLPDADSGS